ncbi:MAG: cyclic nucleotide-binding domain-containing protein [Candidatus Omnitrophica bacterium]|nr:cyclic nucleotide-binding domain-containing protein [Candidatus Omnitrophota bacterium]
MQVDRLKKIPLFCDLSDEDLALLASVAIEQSLNSGEAVFQQGDTPDGLYVVLSGNVQIEHESLFSTERVSTLLLSDGDFFGEMALFDSGVRSATARAVEGAVLLKIDRGVFQNLVSEHPATAGKLILPLMQAIVPRMRQTNRHIVALFEAGRALGGQEDLDALLKRLLEILSEATHADLGVIYLSNPISESLDPAAAISVPRDQLQSLSQREEKWVPVHVSAHGKPLLIADSSTDERCQVLNTLRYEPGSLILVPLPSAQGVLGVIEMGRSSGTFSPNDLNLVDCVAHQVGQALQSIRLQQDEEGRERLKRQRYSF